MSTKQLIILFIILFFLPAALGKVSLTPLLDAIKTLSLQNIWDGFVAVFKADWSFYLGWVTPWVQKLIDFIKSNLPKLPSTTP